MRLFFSGFIRYVAGICPESSDVCCVCVWILFCTSLWLLGFFSYFLLCSFQVDKCCFLLYCGGTRQGDRIDPNNSSNKKQVAREKDEKKGNFISLVYGISLLFSWEFSSYWSVCKVVHFIFHIPLRKMVRIVRRWWWGADADGKVLFRCFIFVVDWMLVI